MIIIDTIILSLNYCLRLILFLNPIFLYYSFLLILSCKTDHVEMVALRKWNFGTRKNTVIKIYGPENQSTTTKNRFHFSI